jgi:hypothetical protein
VAQLKTIVYGISATLFSANALSRARQPMPLLSGLSTGALVQSVTQKI